LEQLEARIETEAKFTKEVTIKDNKTGLSGTFVFYTNIYELLNFITEGNITLKKGEVEVDQTFERNLIIEETDDEEFVPIDINRNIVRLEVLNISLPDQEDVPVFSFKLEDELQSAINRYNALTIINTSDNQMSRGCRKKRSSVRMTSDGWSDLKKAQVRVYYNWNNCTFLDCREGKFYKCLTSKVTNTGVPCNAAYIDRIVVVNGERVWLEFFDGCNASC